MSHVVRRSTIGVALATCVSLAGCGGGPVSGAAAGAAPASTAAKSYPSPAGAGCAGVGDIEALAELGLVEAVTKIGTAQTFAGFLAADPARQKQYAGLGGVTVFVPVDSAWTKLDAAGMQKMADPYWHQAVVEYSIVSAEMLPQAFTGQETSAMPTFRAPGEMLSGTMVGETIVLNGHANVLCSSIRFDGGLIYLIDSLLFPSG